MRTLLVLLFAALVFAQGKKKEPEEPLSAFLFLEKENVKHSINLTQVRAGTRNADPRDAIPAIKKPEHAPADKAPWVLDNQRVIGLVVNGEARAYPLYILSVHEMVDDVLGGVPVAPNY